MPVHEVMTPEILWCFDDADLTTAANFMKARSIQHLAVLDHDHQLVGVVSLYALAIHTRDEALAGTAAPTNESPPPSHHCLIERLLAGKHVEAHHGRIKDRRALERQVTAHRAIMRRLFRRRGMRMRVFRRFDSLAVCCTG